MKIKKEFSLKTKAIFNALYQILILIVPVITTPYISRVLGPDNNGDYGFYYSIVSYFAIFATFGFVDYGTKKIAEARDNKTEMTKCFIGIFLTKFFLGLISLIAYILTSVIIYKSDINTMWMVLTFSFHIVSIMLDPLFYFQGQEKFISICVRNIILKLLSTILIFVLVKDSNDLFTYILILSVSQLFSVLITWPIIKKGEFVKIHFKDINFKKYFLESIPYFISTLAVSLFTYLNQTLMGVLGASRDEQGYFSQAVKIVSILCTIPSSLSIIMLSRISYLSSKEDIVEINSKISKTFEVLWVITIPLFLGLISINDEFVPLFLGEEYKSSIILIYILAPTLIFSPLNTIYGSLYYRPRNKIRIQTIAILISSVLNVIISVLLIPKFGAIGAAAGRIIAEFCQIPILVYYSRKDINVSNVLKPCLKPLISGVIMFTIVVLTKFLFIRYTSVSSIMVCISTILVGMFIYGIMEITLKQDIVLSFIRPIIAKFKKPKNTK